MLKRIIPTILIENKEVIKTIRFSRPTYIGDLLNTIKIYNELQVDELCILDKSAKINGINFPMIEQFTNEAFSPISYGGGIANMKDIGELLRIGIEKVVISTNATNYGFIESAVKTYGSSTISICIDYKLLGQKRIVFVENGKKNTSIEVMKYLRKLSSLGVGEFILQSIDRDGTYNGYDTNFLKDVVFKYNNPIVVSGGCSNLLDIKKAFDLEVSGTAAGSLFVYYTNKKGVLINYPDLDELIDIGVVR